MADWIDIGFSLRIYHQIYVPQAPAKTAAISLPSGLCIPRTGARYGHSTLVEPAAPGP